MYMIVHFRDQKTHYLYYYMAPSLPCKGPDLKNAITVSLGIRSPLFRLDFSRFRQKSFQTAVGLPLYMYTHTYSEFDSENYLHITSIRPPSCAEANEGASAETSHR